jgi:hypothetical protein
MRETILDFACAVSWLRIIGYNASLDPRLPQATAPPDAGEAQPAQAGMGLPASARWNASGMLTTLRDV